MAMMQQTIVVEISCGAGLRAALDACDAIREAMEDLPEYQQQRIEPLIDGAVVLLCDALKVVAKKGEGCEDAKV